MVLIEIFRFWPFLSFSSGRGCSCGARLWCCPCLRALDILTYLAEASG